MVAIPLDTPRFGESLSAGIAHHSQIEWGRYAEALSTTHQPYRFVLRSVLGTTLEIVFTDTPPVWAMHVMQAMQTALQLPSNWNSYGASRVDARIAEAALRLLFSIMEREGIAPDVIPTNRGGIQFEWHYPDLDVEITVSATNAAAVAVEDYGTGMEWEGDAFVDRAKVKQYLGQLSTSAR